MLDVEIQVEGKLDSSWAKWLDGFTITYTQQGETVLRGEIKDQAALYGLIGKLRDLGVTLIRVQVGTS
ncbi:MAG: hypothetical protein JW862_09530 [Anaerolineales bacterium]|nr:hypothetical protein [Anaerolineales bacterium]